MLDRLPPVRGSYTEQVDLSTMTWFRVGGPADVVFQPADPDDLSTFLASKPSDIPVVIMGVGSNLLVRDGGLRGVLIRLGGRAFASVTVQGEEVIAGAGALDAVVARAAQKHSLTGLEFLRGIPGTLGGAVRMNAGAYGQETKDIIVSARAIDSSGHPLELSVDEMGFAYRRSSVPDGTFVTEVTLRGRPGDPAAIADAMAAVTQSREATQPIRSRTGGSTFKNPDPSQTGGRKAWQLIDEAGCRGLTIGGAQVSELHCNFLINRGDATAHDIETLGETVRSRVAEATGVSLDWEIKRVGEPLKGPAMGKG